MENESDAFVKKLGDAHEEIHHLTSLVSTQDSHIMQLEYDLDSAVEHIHVSHDAYQIKYTSLTSYLFSLLFP